MTKKLYNTSSDQERAVLVGIITPNETEEQEKEYLLELAFLVETAGGMCIRNFTQKVQKPDIRTYVGKGKLEEIKEYVKAEEADIVVFDDELSPSQLRNIEFELQCRVLDRSGLILDIFARRAKSAQAKTQVELAQCQYMLPRLKRLWTHLERQKGGIGMRGPGESQIETDRRIILTKITLLKDKLELIDKQTGTQRKNRNELIRVALVGYTNVGKSTIMNLLSKSEVFAENKLFATLDTTVRKMVIENIPFLLSDTVGFIRKLPHHLVECFKSTLSEVKEADILMHVVDISHTSFEEQIIVVNETLKELESLDKPTIMVFNKVDAYHNEDQQMSIQDFEKSWMSKTNTPAIFISALNKQNVEQFRKMIYDKVKVLQQEKYPNQSLLY